MAQALSVSAIEKQNRYFLYPVTATGQAVSTRDITAALALTFDNVDLNGVSFLKFNLFETAGSNNIGTFTITANYYSMHDELIVTQDVVVPEVLAGKKQEVYIANDSLALGQSARYADITFTLPHSGSDYSIEVCIEAGMFEEKNENVFTPKWDTLFNGSAVSGGTVNFSGNINAAGGLSLLSGAVGATAPTDNITFQFFLDREQTMKFGSDVVVAIPGSTTGTASASTVPFTDFDKVVSYKATGTITPTAGLTDFRLYLVKTQLV